MALKVIEGFDFKDSVTKLNSANANTDQITETISVETGRFAGNSLRCRKITTVDPEDGAERASGSLSLTTGDLTQGIIGFAFKQTVNNTADSLVFVTLNNEQVSNGTVVFGLVKSSGNIFKLYQGGTLPQEGTVDGALVSTHYSPGTLLGSFTLASYAANNWYYFEIKLTGSNVTVNVDGIEQYNTSHAITTFDILCFCNYDIAGPGTTVIDNDVYFDDVYVKDDLTFLGPQRIDLLTPDTVTTSEGTSIGGADAVETLATDDAKHQLVDVDELELLEFTNFAQTGTINGVSFKTVAEKDGVQPRFLYPVVRESSTNYQGTPKVELIQTTGGDGFYQEIILENNPADDSAFTQSDINNNSFGIIVKDA